MISINLLPKEIIERQKFKQIILLSMIGFVLVVFLLIVNYILRASTLVSLKTDLRRLETELKKIEPLVNEVNQLKLDKQHLEERKALVYQLIENGFIYPKFMEELLKLLPEDLWLSNMNTTILEERDQKSGEKKIVGIQVGLSCSSYDKISIADFLSNLENNPKFVDIKLGPINTVQKDKYELHNFTISFVYKI